MTIKFIADYPPYKIGNTVSLTSAEEISLVNQKVAVTDLTGGVPYVPSVTNTLSSVVAGVLTDAQKTNQNIKGVAGVGNGKMFDEQGNLITTRYLGPISPRSNLPKSSAYPKYQLSSSNWPIEETGNYLELCMAMLSQPKENMKAGAGYTNGYGDMVNTVMYKGISYPVNTEFFRCEFGDVAFLGVYIPSGFKAGDVIDVLTYIEQSPHNDPSGAAANQYMTFMNFIPAKDFSYAANSLTQPQRDAWKLAVTSGAFPSSPPSGAGVVHSQSFRPLGILGYTSKKTFEIFSTSRDQGEDTPMIGTGLSAIGAADYFIEGYGIGEIQSIIGSEYNVINVGISSEKAEDLTTPSAIFGRKKIAEHCAGMGYCFGSLINDAGAMVQATAWTTWLGWYNAWRGMMPANREIWGATCGYRGASSDYLTSLSGQSRTVAYSPVKDNNSKVRALQLPGQSHYIECVLGPRANRDQGRFPVPDYAAIVNTGTGTIVQADATASLPARTILAWNSAVFKPEHHGAYITIPAAGASGAKLQAQIEWPDYQVADRADVWLVIREGAINRIPTTMLLGGAGAVGSPLALTAPTNTLYIGSEEVTQDYLHLSKRGKQELVRNNCTDGLI